MIKLLLPLILIVSCSPTKQCYQYGDHWRMTEYTYKPTRYSALGYGIDDPSGQLNTEKLDSALTNVITCLIKALPLTDEEMRAGWCTTKYPDVQIRSCLVVKAAPEWHISQCTGNQIFDCNAPIASCLIKGQVPTDECKCSCRAALQDNTMLVTAPNLELVPWRFTELVSGCDQIQNIPRLALCGDAD